VFTASLIVVITWRCTTPKTKPIWAPAPSMPAGAPQDPEAMLAAARAALSRNDPSAALEAVMGAIRSTNPGNERAM